jgi:hypothetical protein
MRTVIAPDDSDRYFVESSGGVEFLANSPKADALAEHLKNRENLLLPTIIAYQVYKKLLREQTQALADAPFSGLPGVPPHLVPDCAGVRLARDSSGAP